VRAAAPRDEVEVAAVGCEAEAAITHRGGEGATRGGACGAIHKRETAGGARERYTDASCSPDVRGDERRRIGEDDRAGAGGAVAEVGRSKLPDRDVRPGRRLPEDLMSAARSGQVRPRATLVNLANAGNAGEVIECSHENDCDEIRPGESYHVADRL